MNCAVPSVYALWSVGSIRVQIFSVERLLRHTETLVMAACFTSASVSFRSRANV